MSSGSAPDSRRPSRAVGDGLMSVTKVENYRSVRGASAYYRDHQSKLHRRLSDGRERRILTAFLERAAARRGRRARTLLDCPCGYGRLLDLFRAFADSVVEADFSPSMLALNEQLHGDAATAYEQCSALEIPRPDRAFDVVASIRLSHHLEDVEDRRRHIGELCRVSADTVVLTFFSATSLKNRLRRLRGLWNRKRAKHTLHPAEVRATFAAHGFDVLRMVPLARLGSGHVYALARRRG